MNEGKEIMDFYQQAIANLGWVEVTLWYRMIDGYDFNHLEHGHSKNAEPIPVSKEQKKYWSGGKWSKRIWYATKTNNTLEVMAEY